MLKTALWMLIFCHDGKIPTCCTTYPHLWKKEKFIRGENISLEDRRKRPNNGSEEKSLKDAGQFLVVKKFL